MTPSVFPGNDRSGLHLLVFGGGNPGIRRAARRLGREAVATGWFGNVVVLHEEHLVQLDRSFFHSRANLFSGDSLGFGYWCWKPFILQSYLSQQSLKADAVMYIDAGCHLNVTSQSERRLHEMVEQVKSDGSVFFSLREHLQGEWISAEAAAHLGMTTSDMLMPQVMSTMFILRNDDEARDLISQWLTLSQYLGGTLLKSTSPHHRHDQSLLSHVVYESGHTAIPDETWSDDWKSMTGFPFWAVRNRTGFRHRQSPAWNLVNRILERARSRLGVHSRSRRSRAPGQ